MKKYIALFGLMAAMLLALSACGKKQSPQLEATVGITGEETEAGTAEPSGEAIRENAPLKEPSGTTANMDEIEAFAERTQEAVADHDIEALSRLLHYPVKLKTSDGRELEIRSREELKSLDPDSVFGDQLVIAIANIDTASLLMGESGVDMGDELSWVTFQVFDDGELGITRINQ